MRIARQHAAGVVYHLIWRFVDREWFFANDDDRQFYLRLLARALAESDWRCISFALMSNHIHIGAVAGSRELASWSRRVNAPFALWMNERHKRLGPIFADRASAYGVLPENEGAMIAYIHKNPVRAGVVGGAEDTTWTSHRAYLGHGSVPPWLHVDEGLRRAGFTGRSRFDAWVNGQAHERDSVDLAAVRRAVRSRGSLELATPTLGDTTTIPLVVRHFGHMRPDPRRIVRLVCEVLDVGESAVCSRRRAPALRDARIVAVQVGRALGLTGNDLAAVLGVSAQAIVKTGRALMSDTHRELCRVVTGRL